MFCSLDAFSQKTTTKLMFEMPQAKPGFIAYANSDFLKTLVAVIFGGIITLFVNWLKMQHDKRKEIQVWYEDYVISTFSECLRYYSEVHNMYLTKDFNKLKELKPCLESLSRLSILTGTNSNNYKFYSQVYYALQGDYEISQYNKPILCTIFCVGRRGSMGLSGCRLVDL
ncbi:hypothetical protein P0136_11200 [Lentisphaerota bacterium ZTH]|nr:hypothetical protein JYG24_11280 [Lentisphaerota bacterium]WET05925.1 hypothetical protein P0136_11200 [Lentisphaerota bacterium ZTH]